MLRRLAHPVELMRLPLGCGPIASHPHEDMKKKTRYPMKHFANHDDQDAKDLVYGKQIAWCRAFANDTPKVFEDHSITHEWTPDED